MNARFLGGLVVAVALIAASEWVRDSNAALMSQSVRLWSLPGQAQPVTVTVGNGFLLCALLGAVAIAGFWAMRSTQAIVGALMERRSTRVERENEATYQRGLETLLNGRPERALDAMNEVLASDPDHAGALMTGADILRSLGRPAEAAAWRERRLLATPEDVPVLYALAEDYRQRGDLPLAASTLERVITLRPKQGKAAAERLRETLIESGEYERALVAHDRLIRMGDGQAEGGVEADVDRAGLETRWAMQQAESGRTRDAAGLLRKVLKRHPRYVPAWLALARTQVIEGDEDQAVETWIDGFERTNEAAILVEAEDWFLESRHEGDPIERAGAALRAFKRFAACSGPRPLAVAFLGKLYTRHEMLDDAAAAFDSVREAFPENPTFTYYSGRIAEKQGRPEAAARLYRAIIKSTDMLNLRFRCRHCGTRATEFEDRCSTCRRWGTSGLDVGPEDDSLHPPRPLYAVPEDDAGRLEQDALA